TRRWAMSSRLERRSCGVRAIRAVTRKNARKRSHNFHSRPNAWNEPTNEREARSMDQPGTLAQLLSQGLEQQAMTVDAVSERTKVPRATLRVLLGATDPAILPQRIYLRGQVGVLAKEL